MTTLVPKTDLVALAVNHAISLNDLLDNLAQAKPSPQAENPKAPTTKIAISDVQRSLLRRLSSVLVTVELPDTVRLLTVEERRDFIRLFEQVKDAKTAVANAEKALHETFSNHLDVEAKQVSNGSLETDKNGHVLAEGEVTAPGEPKKVTRELRGGGANPITIADLMRLENLGKITHQQFLQMTEAVPASRRVDETKIMDAVAKDVELIDILADVVTVSDRTSAIYVRKSA